MGFSGQEYRNVQPLLSPGPSPDPIKSVVEIKGEEVEQWRRQEAGYNSHTGDKSVIGLRKCTRIGNCTLGPFEFN